MFLRIGYILLLQLMSFLVSAELSVVTCNMPSVQAGEDATLTCNFGENLNADKPDVLVKSKTSDSSTWKDVLDCYKNPVHYKCDVKDNQFNHTSGPSKTIVLVLKNASKAKEGTYKCAHLPETDGGFQPCTFKLNPTDTTSPTTGGSTEEEPSSDNIGLIVAVVGAVIVLVVIVVIVVIVFKRGMCPPKKPASTTSEEDQSLNAKTAPGDGS